MYAEVGDQVIVNGDNERIGLIIRVPHSDGTPPYVIKWLATGHIAMVTPGFHARVIRADPAPAAGPHRANGRADHPAPI